MTQRRFKHSCHPCRVSTAMIGVISALVPKQLTFRCESLISRDLYQVREFLKQANGKSFFLLASLDKFELQSMEKKNPNNKQTGKPKILLVFTDTFRSRIILQNWLFQLLRKPAQASNNRKNTQGHRQALFGEKLPSDCSDKLCKAEPCIAMKWLGDP